MLNNLILSVQLSKVYKTVKLETVFAQAENILSPSEMEKVIVEAVRDQLVDARLDHQNKSIHFGSQVCIFVTCFLTFVYLFIFLILISTVLLFH